MTEDHRDALSSLEQQLRQLREQYQELHQLVENLVHLVQTLLPGAPKGHLEGFDYFLLETFYRGDRDQIRSAQEKYLRFFEGKNPVIDIGCGRGEFLEMLVERGWDAYGIDLSRDMVLLCRDLGLDVQQEDAIEHLQSRGDEEIGGIFCSQFVEHLSAQDLIDYIELCHTKLKPGGILIAETVNPQCLSVFANTFYVDLTHHNPVHPRTLKFLMESIGFMRVEIEYCSFYPREHMLRKLQDETGEPEELQSLVKTMNFNIDALNYVLFGPQDYAAIGYKSAETEEQAAFARKSMLRGTAQGEGI